MRKSAVARSVQQNVHGQPEKPSAAAVRVHTRRAEPGRHGGDAERHDRLAAGAAGEEISHTSSDIHVRGRFRRCRMTTVSRAIGLLVDRTTKPIKKTYVPFVNRRSLLLSLSLLLLFFFLCFYSQRLLWLLLLFLLLLLLLFFVYYL